MKKNKSLRLASILLAGMLLVGQFGGIMPEKVHASEKQAIASGYDRQIDESDAGEGNIDGTALTDEDATISGNGHSTRPEEEPDNSQQGEKEGDTENDQSDEAVGPNNSRPDTDKTTSDNDLSGGDKNFHNSQPNTDGNVSDNGLSDGEGSVSGNGISKVPADGSMLTEKKGQAEELTDFSTALMRGDAQHLTALRSGDEISLREELWFQIKRDDLAGIEEQISYTVQIPEELQGGSNGTADIKPDPVMGIDEVYAHLSWDIQNGQAVVDFENHDITLGGMESTLFDSLRDIQMAFQVSLREEALQANERGEVTITLPGTAEQEITLTIAEYKPKEAALEKSVGSLADDGKAAWEVLYTAPTAGWAGERPAYITDELPAGLLPVGRIQVSAGEIKDSLAWDTEQTGYSFTYPIPENIPAGQTISFSYETKMDTAALTELWTGTDEKQFTNRAQALDAEKTPVKSASAALTVPTDWPGRKLLSKKNIDYPNAQKPAIQWELTVNTFGQQFETLVLHDILGTALTLDENAGLRINGKVLEKADYTYQYAEDPQRPDIEIDFRQIDPAQDGRYQITYTTKVEQAYFTDPDRYGADALENKAYLTFTWPSGQGPEPGEEAFRLPAVEINPGSAVSNGALILKEKGAYDHQNHSMTWKVTLNPNQVNLTKAVLTDVLSGDDHVFYTSEAEMQDRLAAIRVAVESAQNGVKVEKIAFDGPKKLDMVLTGVGTQTLEFEITSYSIDPKKWAGNQEAAYHNAITLLGQAEGQDFSTIGGEALLKDSFGKAVHQVQPNVLQKSATAFEPETHKLTWQIIVNESLTPLGEVLTGTDETAVTVTDILPTGLSYVKDSARLTTDSGTETAIVPAEQGQQLIFELTKGQTDQKKAVLCFDTLVDVNTADFYTDGKAGLKNEVSMISAVNQEPVKTDALAEISGKPVEKTAKKGTGNRVNYTVEINPLGMKLLQKGPLLLQDTMDAGLVLDESSVKLYSAQAIAKEAAEKGSYQISNEKKEEVPDTEYQVAYDLQKNHFRITIPQADQPYVLEYTAYAMTAGVKLGNRVNLQGTVLPESGQSGLSQSDYLYAASGGATFALPNGMEMLEITKTDESGNPLSGAVFAIYSAQDTGALICEAISGSDGKARFVYQKGMKPAFFREVAPPDGYIPDTEWKKIDQTMLQTGDLGKLENSRETEANNGKLKIVAKDEQGNLLSGAIFNLYEEETCTTLAGGPITTGEEGTAAFYGLDPKKSYWLKTTAPQGYQALPEVIEIKPQTGTMETVVPVEVICKQVALPAEPSVPAEPQEPTEHEGHSSGSGKKQESALVKSAVSDNDRPGEQDVAENITGIEEKENMPGGSGKEAGSVNGAATADHTALLPWLALLAGAVFIIAATCRRAAKRRL